MTDPVGPLSDQPAATSSPILEEWRQAGRNIRKRHEDMADNSQFTIIMVGVFGMTIACLLSIVGLALLIKDTAVLAVIVTAIVAMVGTLTGIIIAAINKIDRLDQKVEEGLEQTNGHLGELLVLKGKDEARKAVVKERKEVAQLAADNEASDPEEIPTIAAPTTTQHVEEMTVEKLTVEKVDPAVKLPKK